MYAEYIIGQKKRKKHFVDYAFFLTEVKLTYKTDTINVCGLNMKQQMRLNELINAGK